MRALGIVAAAFFLATATADAQDQSCTLRCTTIHQTFDEEVVATIALTCDAMAVHCAGDGALRINGTMVPTSVTATYSGITMMLRIQTDQGVLTSGAPRDIMTAMPDGTFGIILGNTAEPLSKRVALRWFILKKPNGSNSRLDQNIGGHLNILIDRYAPARPSNI